MPLLDHEKLSVYNLSLEFIVIADQIVSNLPRGRGYLADQLQRAALSISLNIAEGAGEFAKDEKARFYRIAKRSGTECASILQACQKLQLIETKVYEKGYDLLTQIVAMLIKLCQK